MLGDGSVIGEFGAVARFCDSRIDVERVGDDESVGRETDLESLVRRDGTARDRLESHLVLLETTRKAIHEVGEMTGE